MEVLFETHCSAKALAEAGVTAAAKFDDGCSLPCTSQVVPLDVAQRVAVVN